MLKKIFSHSFVRYVIVGLISVGVDYGVLLVAYRALDVDLAVATTTGFVVGLIVNFLLNKFWSFNTSHDKQQTARQAVLVGLLVVFNLIVTNLVVIYLEKINIGPEISKVITTGMITLWNYVLYKKYIFKEPEPIA